LLERLNYRVTTSNNAREAVALFNANPAQFDLLITDMTMLEMNGLEVARQCHTLRPELPVILASGLTSNLTSENLLAAAICDLLEKLVAINDLAGTLQRALDESQSAGRDRIFAGGSSRAQGAAGQATTV
jgi:DNA-binding NtrC family response regulator